MSEWKKIPGHPKYEARSDGEVRNAETGYVMKGFVNHEGYRLVGLSDVPNKQTGYSVHRLIAFTFIPNPDQCPCVNHKNNIKSDNRAENLEWVSFQENTEHAYKIGAFDNAIKFRVKRFSGEGSNHAKLDWKKVTHIKNLYKTGEFSHRELSKIFCVSEMSVWAVLNGKSWKEEHRPLEL